MNYHKILLKKINNKTLKVGVIGLGYVGLPLVISLGNKKIFVYGFDIDQKKISQLKLNKSYLNTIKNNQIKKIKKYFLPTNKFDLIKNCDVILICVPTPLKKKFIPDLKYLQNTLYQIKKFLKPGQFISLESTSYPGTTSEEVVSKLCKKFLIGENFFIGFSPEREDPGNKKFQSTDITKIISGHTKSCLNISEKFYRTVFKNTYSVKNTQTAEFTKLLENIYRSVNIGLVNEMKIIANLMKIDINEIIEAASTKPFGFKAFQPGPGMGGHCIPIDPFYMSWKSKKLGYEPTFIKNSGLINSLMPRWIVKQILKEFKRKKFLHKNKRILIIGVSYKKNIDDTRESPSFEIMNLLIKKKIKIDYHDPHVPILEKTRKFNFNMKSKKLDKKMLKKYSAAIIVTDHDKINYSLLANNAKLIFDCRGKLRKKFKSLKSKYILL